MSQPDLDWDLRSGAADAADPDRDLRAELEAAIEIRRDADAVAERATGIAAIADNLLREAAAEVTRLQSEQWDAERLTTERRAKAIAMALRSGSDLPAPPLPSPADSAPLAAAMATHSAIEIAAGKLAAERDAALTEAAKAAEAVHGLAYAIGVTAEAYDRADKLIADQERLWADFDCLAGLILLDERQPCGPTLRALQESVIRRIDRHKANIDRDPLMIERPRYHAYLDGRASAEERRRIDYLRRLANDPTATFDARGESAQ